LEIKEIKMSQMMIDYLEGFSTRIYSTEAQDAIVTDAPKNHGGNGLEFSPTDLFAASLGACVVTIMGMHAKKLGVSFEGVKAKVIKNQGAVPGGIGEILVHVYYPGRIENSLREKLEKAAMHCPIHQSIDPKIRQEIVFHWEEGIQ
jgi:putative redox protein